MRNLWKCFKSQVQNSRRIERGHRDADPIISLISAHLSAIRRSLDAMPGKMGYKYVCYTITSHNCVHWRENCAQSICKIILGILQEE